MAKEKAFDKNKFDTCDTIPKTKAPATPQDLIDSGIPVRTQTGGLANTPPIQPTVQRNISFGERVNYFGNAAIVMGPQRNTNELSGEGKSGFPSDTIDIVTGFNDGGENCNGQIVNVNAITDAARVYVSRAVKVDTMFGIAREPKPKAEKARSAVVMKADTARIIGRTGIKLVTGRAQGAVGAGSKGERTSRGGDYEQSPKIDLIAGNNIGSYELPFPELMKPFINSVGRLMPWYESKYEYLQPTIMGENMRIALTELADVIDSAISAQMTINLAMTVVMEKLGEGLSAIPGGQPLGVPLMTLGKLLDKYGPKSQYSIKSQLTTWEDNFLNNNATRYICSKNVRIT